MTVLAVLVSGGLGALARYELSGWVQRRVDSSRPWGTVVVNLTGAVLLALLVVGWRSGVLGDGWMLLGGTGFAAGFTTFSTWMVEAVRLSEAGPAGRRAALADVTGQLAAGVGVALLILLWW